MKADEGLLVLVRQGWTDLQGEFVYYADTAAQRDLAARCGFRRFSVLGPNNGTYWSRIMDYTAWSTRFFTNLEADKELPAG